MQFPEPIAVECDRAVRTSRSGDTRLGLQIASQAYRRARAEDDPKGLLTALNAVAICQSSSGAHINALGTAIDAYRLARGLGDRRGTAHAMLSLVAASQDLFDVTPPPESLAMVRQCLVEARALGDVSLQARAHNVLGNALVRQRHYAEGLEAFERSLALLPASDGTTPAALIAGNIAHLAVRWAESATPEERPTRIAEASRSIDIALEMAVADQAEGAELRAHFNRGWLLHVEGHDAEALEPYGRALALATRLKNRSRIADVNFRLGDALAALDRLADAASAYEAAYSVADEIRPARQLQETCDRLAAIQDRLGDAQAADRARRLAAAERAFYDRERGHACQELERILKEMQGNAA